MPECNKSEDEDARDEDILCPPEWDVNVPVGTLSERKN